MVIFQSSYFCDKLKTLQQEKETASNSIILNEEIVAITDKQL